MKIETERVPVEIRQENETYLNIITDLDRTCNELGLDHRFVGGTFTDLLNLQTEAEIDPDNKIIHLQNYNSPRLIRSDRTIKDADLICFCKDIEQFKFAQRALHEKMKETRKKGNPYPYVSIEPTYHPDWPKRQRWKQLVSTFDVDENNELSLNFRNIHQPIKWESVEPWKVDLGEDSSFTILNPYAHALCYVLRTPSGVKPKDKTIMHENSGLNSKYNKMSLVMRIAKETANADNRAYPDDLYDGWIKYIKTVAGKPDLETKIAAGITDVFWKTVGEATSHGRGVFGVFSEFSDRFKG